MSPGDASVHGFTRVSVHATTAYNKCTLASFMRNNPPGIYMLFSYRLLFTTETYAYVVSYTYVSNVPYPSRNDQHPADKAHHMPCTSITIIPCNIVNNLHQSTRLPTQAPI